MKVLNCRFEIVDFKLFARCVYLSILYVSLKNSFSPPLPPSHGQVVGTVVGKERNLSFIQLFIKLFISSHLLSSILLRSFYNS